MKKLNKHTTLKEIKALLDDSSTRGAILELLKNHNSDLDDVNGLLELLKKNNWNYEVVKTIESNAGSDFQALLNQSEKSKFPWLKVAAVVVPLVGLAVFFALFFQQSAEVDKLYSKYYVKERGLPTLMSSDYNKKFDEAMASFKDGAYKEAESTFKELYHSETENDTLVYFLGCTKMELDDFDGAIEMFEKVPFESTFEEKSQFRLSFCYIKTENYSEAEEMLIQISQDETHTFNKKASEMLEESVFE